MESKLGKVLKIKIEVMLKKYWTQESEGEEERLQQQQNLNNSLKR